MKKTFRKMILAWMLLACLLLAACGGTDNGETPVTTPTEAPAGETPTAEPTEEPTEAPTQEPTPEPTVNPNVESGTNVALGCEVETSSTTGEMHVQWGWMEDFINDGITSEDNDPTSAGWTTAVQVNFDDPEQEEWVILTLDSPVMVNKIILYPVAGGSFFPIDYHVEVSMDGKTYTKVGEVKGDTHYVDKSVEPVVFEFEAVAAHYVRFVATYLYDFSVEGAPGVDGYLCQLAEIEVYAA